MSKNSHPGMTDIVVSPDTLIQRKGHFSLTLAITLPCLHLEDYGRTGGMLPGHVYKGKRTAQGCWEDKTPEAAFIPPQKDAGDRVVGFPDPIYSPPRRVSSALSPARTG